MWPQEFKNLEELKLFMIHQLNYDEQAGFSFFQIAPGMELEKIMALLGEPHQSSFEAEEQQTIHYNVLIDHPVHGKRDHHRLNALFWAFHREPLYFIRLHIAYYNTGESAEAFFQFSDELFKTLLGKFGKPEKKSFRQGRKELTYTREKHKLSAWLNAEGIRIQIQS